MEAGAQQGQKAPEIESLHNGSLEVQVKQL